MIGKINSMAPAVGPPGSERRQGDRRVRTLDSDQGHLEGMLVETRGIEPLTPALQRRCSAN
jgi:hypothetical protein